MTKRNVKQWYGHGNRWWRRRINRKYKDVLFRRLFREKQDLLDLYNALNGSTYKNPGELEVITMEDVIFMKGTKCLRHYVRKNLRFFHLLEQFPILWRMTCHL